LDEIKRKAWQKLRYDYLITYPNKRATILPKSIPNNPLLTISISYSSISNSMKIKWRSIEQRSPYFRNRCKMSTSVYYLIYIRIFMQYVPPDVIKMFESTLIFINFRENCIRIDFREFDELLPYMFKKFNVRIFEERTLVMIFKSTKTNICIMKLLY
jgi:hypothetical protein